MPEKWAKPEPEEMRAAVDEALADLESIKREILSVRDHHTPGARILRHNYWGTLAATRKRLAEVEFLTGRGDWRETLKAARSDCRAGLEAGAKADHWTLGQYVVLTAVLLEAGKGFADGRESLSEKAWRASLLALENMDPGEKMWAHSSIADLLIVAQAESRPRDPKLPGDTSTDLLFHLKEMVTLGGGPDECQALWPTFRQFWRWRYWWTSPKWAAEAQRGFDYLWPLLEPRFGLRDTASGLGTRDSGPWISD
jgi:hypothetical protein